MKKIVIRSNFICWLFFVLVAALSSTRIAYAVDGTWTNTGTGGLWSDTANWSGGTVADGSGATANFNTLDITADNTVQLDSARTLTNLTFGDITTSTAGGWIIGNNATPANILTLAGTTPTITVNALGTGKSATISAVIAGTNGLVKDGAGTLNLGTTTTVNTFTGGLTIKAGTVGINFGGGSGSTGAITIGDSVGSAAATLNINGVGGPAPAAFTNGINLGGSSGALTISEATAGGVSFTGGVTGTNNLILALNHATGGSMSFASINNTGTITNAGTGVAAGTVTITSLGSNVTRLIENSNTKLILSAANTAFIGDTTLTLGTLNLQNTNSLQNSVLNMNGGSVTFGTSTTVAITSATLGGLSGSGNINLNNTLTTPTAVNLTIGNSNVSYGSNTLNPTYSGILSNTNGAATLTKIGTNTQTLSGNNTYTGATTVSAGTLLINGSLAAGSAVGVTGGFLGGTGTVNGAVTVSSTGGLKLTDGSVGTLTLGNTLNITGVAGANNLYFDLANAGASTDKIAATGNVSVTNAGAAVINLNQLGGSTNRLTAGTYDLITTAGTMSAASNFALATSKAFGQSYSLALDGTSQKLQVTTTQITAATPAAFWAGTTDANWSTAGNWRTSVAGNIVTGAAPDYQTNVTFVTTTPVAGNLTNTVDADMDINSLTFNAAGGGVTIGGTKMLTIEATNANGNTAGNGITSNNTSGTNTISAKVGIAGNQTWTVASGGTMAVTGAITDFGGGYSLSKSGLGTLTLNGANTFSGGLNILAGTVNTTSSSAVLGTGAITLGDSSGGSNSTTLNLISSGATTLIIANAISVASTNTGTATISQDNNASGHVVISGGILLNSHDLTIQGGSAWNLTVSGGITGTGNLTINRTSGGSNTFSVNAINNIGSITHSNTGGAATTISSAIGSNVTNITQNGTTAMSISGAMTMNSAGRTFTASNTGVFTVSGGINGAGNLIINNNSTTANGVTLSTTSVNNTGTITNSGTGTGSTLISSVIGSNVTGVIQNSATSALTLSAVNTYTGATTITAGTLALSGAGSINNTSGVSVTNGGIFSNGSSVAYNKALTIAEGAILSGTGVTGSEFTPTSMTITANLIDGFSTFALGTTGLTKAGNLEFTLSNITAGSYTVFTGSALLGTFSTMTIGGSSISSLGGGDFSGTLSGFTYTFTDSSNLFAVSAIPEPSTWLLLFIAVLFVGRKWMKEEELKISINV